MSFNISLKSWKIAHAITMEGAIWKHKKVLVTGGASFIGSHLVDALLERGAEVHVVDDLTSGRLSNIEATPEERARDVRGSRSARAGRCARGDERHRRLFFILLPTMAGAAMWTCTRPVRRPIFFLMALFSGRP